MAWEQRNGRSYYYEKVRKGSKVRSIYRGSGYIGTVAHSLVRVMALDRQRKRLDLAAQLADDVALGRDIAQMAETIDQIVKATLLAAGFHQHKRQWRLRREQKQDRN